MNLGIGGTVLPYSLEGKDPLTGLSAYIPKSGDLLHEHIVTYGFSQFFYDEESVGQDYSQYGFELTFRLKVDAEGEDVNGALNFLQNVAKYVFSTGNHFEEYHYMPANGPIRVGSDTKIHTLCFIEDPELGSMDTPHGKVQFLQVVGLTQKEYDDI